MKGMPESDDWALATTMVPAAWLVAASLLLDELLRRLPVDRQRV
jgi:hypothetical protein